MKWEQLGFGKAAVLYRRTQIVLKAARLLPPHTRLPHKAFLSGLWALVEAALHTTLAAPGFPPNARPPSASNTTGPCALCCQWIQCR